MQFYGEPPGGGGWGPHDQPPPRGPPPGPSAGTFFIDLEAFPKDVNVKGILIGKGGETSRSLKKLGNCQQLTFEGGWDSKDIPSGSPLSVKIVCGNQRDLDSTLQAIDDTLVGYLCSTPNCNWKAYKRLCPTTVRLLREPFIPSGGRGAPQRLPELYLSPPQAPGPGPFEHPPRDAGPPPGPSRPPPGGFPPPNNPPWQGPGGGFPGPSDVPPPMGGMPGSMPGSSGPPSTFSDPLPPGLGFAGGPQGPPGGVLAPGSGGPGPVEPMQREGGMVASRMQFLSNLHKMISSMPGGRVELMYLEKAYEDFYQARFPAARFFDFDESGLQGVLTRIPHVVELYNDPLTGQVFVLPARAREPEARGETATAAWNSGWPSGGQVMHGESPQVPGASPPGSGTGSLHIDWGVEDLNFRQAPVRGVVGGGPPDPYAPLHPAPGGGGGGGGIGEGAGGGVLNPAAAAAVGTQQPAGFNFNHAAPTAAGAGVQVQTGIPPGPAVGGGGAGAAGMGGGGGGRGGAAMMSGGVGVGGGGLAAVEGGGGANPTPSKDQAVETAIIVVTCLHRVVDMEGPMQVKQLPGAFTKKWKQPLDVETIAGNDATLSDALMAYSTIFSLHKERGALIVTALPSPNFGKAVRKQLLGEEPEELEEKTRPPGETENERNRKLRDTAAALSGMYQGREGRASLNGQAGPTLGGAGAGGGSFNGRFPGEARGWLPGFAANEPLKPPPLMGPPRGRSPSGGGPSTACTAASVVSRDRGERERDWPLGGERERERVSEGERGRLGGGGGGPERSMRMDRGSRGDHEPLPSGGMLGGSRAPAQQGPPARGGLHIEADGVGFDLRQDFGPPRGDTERERERGGRGERERESSRARERDIDRDREREMGPLMGRGGPSPSPGGMGPMPLPPFGPPFMVAGRPPPLPMPFGPGGAPLMPGPPMGPAGGRNGRLDREEMERRTGGGRGRGRDGPPGRSPGLGDFDREAGRRGMIAERDGRGGIERGGRGRRRSRSRSR